MNEYSLIFDCKTEENTKEIASSVARFCQQGDVFALNGTLGMGKSVFARAFIQSLCGKVDVPSPTFTLVQMYDAPDFCIYHYDLYRIKSAEEIFELGVEEVMYDGVCLIEWPERMKGYLPKKAINIEISPNGSGRKIEISFNDDKSYQRFSALKELNHE